MPSPADLASKKPTVTFKAATKESLDATTDVVDSLADDATTTLADDANMYRTFTNQAIALIGSPTSDGRMLAANIDLSYRSFPLPFMWCEQSTGGHQNSYTVGVIESASLVGSEVLASGYLLNTEQADAAANEIAHGVSNPSVDLAAADYVYTDKDGNDLDWDEIWDLMDEGEQYYTTFTKAELIGCTLVSTPAFDTKIKLDSVRSERSPALVASVMEAITLATYEPSLFENPKLTRATRPTMDKDTGRIFGHIAEWNSPLRGGTGQKAPRNFNDYANFHTSQVQLDDGRQLAVGRLTVQGGHASTERGVTQAAARAHYDDSCLGYGLVRVGEDDHGIWFSGVPAPGVDPEVFNQGMTSPISGDWRDCGQGLDMIAAHAVNSPGFPIYHGTTDSNGRELAVVASFAPRPTRRDRREGMSAEAMQQAIVDGVLTALRAKDQHDAEVLANQAKSAVLARAAAVVGPVLTDAEKALAAIDGFMDKTKVTDPHAKPTNKHPNSPDSSGPAKAADPDNDGDSDTTGSGDTDKDMGKPMKKGMKK